MNMRFFPSGSAASPPVDSDARCSIGRMLLGLAAVMLVAAGCSHGGSTAREGHEGPPAGFDPVPGMEVREGQVPITESDETFILKAEFRLANRCLAELGLPPVTGPERFAQPDPPEYLSPDELRRGGYQFDFAADAEAAMAAEGDEAEPTAGMSPVDAQRYGVVLMGPHDGPTTKIRTPDGVRAVSSRGCLATARRELYGSLENYLRYEQAVAGTGAGPLRKRLLRNPRYADAVDAWQQCMTAAGSAFPEDFEHGLDYGATALRRRQQTHHAEAGERLSAEEIGAVAGADARCQESSGLFDVRTRLLPAARDAVVKAVGLLAADLIAFQHGVLAKAKTVS